MTKQECKGLTPAQLDSEIKEVFMAHIEVVGDANLKWERLFRFLVMENQRFPTNEPVQVICTHFFSAVHAGEVERFGSSIEAHLKAFGAWFPRYWQNIQSKRTAEALYRLPEVKPIVDTPKPNEELTTQNWNLTHGLSLPEIRNCIQIMDEINLAPEDRKNKPLKGVSGVNNFMARCRESLRRYQMIHHQERV
jgi:hypothetical protein